MADVTDPAFRHILAKYGKPDVTWTEFVSTDGLMSAGQDRLLRDLEFSEIERPIVAQIFGKNPEKFYETAKLVSKLGYDGIDINMGCPERNIVKSGSCSGLIRTPELAKEIVLAAKEGAGDLPVSVKTRIGFSTNIVEEWTSHLLKTEPAVIIMHGRTRKEMSKVPADWNAIGKVVELSKDTDTLVIGNGDIVTLEQADEKIKEYGVDGVMMGRGVFGNPWFFNRNNPKETHTLKQLLEILIEFTKLYEKKLGDIKNFAILKKHFKAFVSDFHGAKELRMQLMEAENASEVEEKIQNFMKEFPGLANAKLSDLPGQD